MRAGYGKNKLFFLVAMVIAGMALAPYGVLGLPRNDGAVSGEGRYAESDDRGEKDGYGEKDRQDSSEGNRQGDEGEAETLDAAVVIEVRDASRAIIYASGNGVILEIGDEESGNEELCIVTAGHVLDRAGADGHVTVSFWEQESWSGEAKLELECSRYEIAEDADLGFLFLPKEQIDSELAGLTDAGESQGNLRPASAAAKQEYDSLQAGDTVQTIGWDENRKVICEGTLLENWIYVEDFGQYMMVADCESREGMSGCGLYNDTGQLIGIVCGGNGERQLAAVPLHVVQARQQDTRKHQRAEIRKNEEKSGSEQENLYERESRRKNMESIPLGVDIPGNDI